MSPILSWTVGEGADKHDVYFGADYDGVDNANTSDVTGLYRGRIDVNSYTPPDVLELGATYYWRIDEVEADETLHRGSVWSFTAEPTAVPIANVTATASSAHSEISGAVKTIDGSGLDTDDLHGTSDADMWLSGSEPNGAWIQYEFDRLHKVHEMRVWNYNITFESVLGYGCKDVIIEISENGTVWTVLANVELPQASGSADYAGMSIALDGAAAKSLSE